MIDPSAYNQGPPKAVRVLVAHSQRMFAEAISVALDRDPDMIVLPEKPSTGLDAVETALKTRPDVMLMDHWLPVIKGPLATTMILAKTRAIKILVISWLHSPSNIVAARQAGAVGYLPMTLGLDQLQSAILRAYAGQPAVNEEEIEQLSANLAKSEAESRVRLELMKALTPRDLKTLWLLSLGRPIKEIADTLAVTTGSLQLRLHRIYQKMGARSQMEAVAMVREHRLITPNYTLNPKTN